MPGKETEPQREQQPNQPYTRAALYRSDAEALLAYNEAQELILTANCDLSTYRFLYKRVPHVVVLGADPGREVDRELAGILDAGEDTQLPADVLSALRERRRRAGRIAPWVEGHYSSDQADQR